MNSLEKAKSILSGVLFIPAAKIADDADLASFDGMDSLSFEMIALEVASHLGREPDPLELLEIRSVKDLAAFLERA